MALFAIGDLHFSTGSDKPMDIFSGWQGYVERLCDSWRAQVAPDDTVVVAGDISWGMTLETALPDFILIDKGRIIEELSNEELNEKCRQYIEIRSNDPEKTVLVLGEALQTENYKLMPDGSVQLYDHIDEMERIAAALSEAKILVTGLKVSESSLENYFLDKIGGKKDE